MARDVFEAPILSERLSTWRWKPAAALSSSAAEALAAELARDLESGAYEVVYAARNRRVLRVESAAEGRLALKEVRHRRLMRRLRIGLGGASAAGHELAIAERFRARGGAAPEPLMRAVLPGLLGVSRERLVLRWLEGYRPLTDCLRDAGAAQREGLLRACAGFLVESAARGLSHGGQSGANLMVSASAGSGDSRDLEFVMIDFADAHLSEGFEVGGLAEDGLRLAAGLRRAGVVDETESEALIAAIVESANAMGEGAAVSEAIADHRQAAQRASG